MGEESGAAVAPRARICLDVDDTLVDVQLRLRPLARELIVELYASGFEVHIWSGVGRRWEIVDRLGVRPYIAGCHLKPLSRYRERLADHGVPFVPDYVVDDYAEVVCIFGGWWIPPPLDPIDRDRRLLDVLYDIQDRFGLPRGFTQTGVALPDATPSGHGFPRWPGTAGPHDRAPQDRSGSPGMTPQPLFKVLGAERMPVHGGSGQWPAPGTWTAPIPGDIVAGRRGYHLCRSLDLPRWLGPEIWAVAYEGDVVACEDTLVVRTARLQHRFETWNDVTRRLFAADCAEHVLPLFERIRPGDDRLRRALAVARGYARGELRHGELRAARAAASAAAHDSAYAVAVACAVADAAADLPAAADAYAAAAAASYEAERTWQAQRLQQYLRGELPAPDGAADGVSVGVTPLTHASR